MACFLPQASKGPFEERALAGQGQPSPACLNGAVRGELRFSLGKSRPFLLLAYVDWSGLVWPSAVARLVSFCRQVESSRVRAQ